MAKAPGGNPDVAPLLDIGPTAPRHAPTATRPTVPRRGASCTARGATARKRPIGWGPPAWLTGGAGARSPLTSRREEATERRRTFQGLNCAEVGTHGLAKVGSQPAKRVGESGAW